MPLILEKEERGTQHLKNRLLIYLYSQKAKALSLIIL